MLGKEIIEPIHKISQKTFVDKFVDLQTLAYGFSLKLSSKKQSIVDEMVKKPIEAAVGGMCVQREYLSFVKEEGLNIWRSFGKNSNGMNENQQALSGICLALIGQGQVVLYLEREYLKVPQLSFLIRNNLSTIHNGYKDLQKEMNIDPEQIKTLEQNILQNFRK